MNMMIKKTSTIPPITKANITSSINFLSFCLSGVRTPDDVIRYAGYRYPVTLLSRMRYTYKKRLLPQPFSYSKSLAFSLDTGFHLAMMPGVDLKPGGKSFRLWATPFHLRRLYIFFVSKSRKIGFRIQKFLSGF